MKNISIIIPFKSQDPVRINNFNYVYAFYKDNFPESELVVGDSRSTPFSRAQAINDGVAKTTNPIVLIGDSDIFYDPAIIGRSIDILDKYAWIQPFNEVRDLSREDSQEIINSNISWQDAVKYNSKGNPQPANGGAMLIYRDRFNAVGGYDERFIGWGGEDDDFVIRLSKIFGGYYKMENPYYHLFHEDRDLTHYKENVKYLEETLRN